MSKKWVLKEPVGLELKKSFPEIAGVILQLLFNRGLTTQKQIDAFLTPDYGQDVLDPFLFPDMEKAVVRIYQAVADKEKIAIHGDYDADGVTSSVVVANVLKTLGADFIVYIPHREKEGYGLNKKTIKYLAKQKVKLIITVDCGISNVLEIDLANEKGIDVIITDHHAEPLELPKAFAIINPKIKVCNYPFYDLAGVGVAYKLAQAIVARDKKGIFSAGYEKWLLDLVAIGTVTDVMPLFGENRALVKYGLVVLNKTKRIGLKLLAEKAGVWPVTEKELMNSENIGYVLGPRINAAGRMDHANSAYELLLTEDKQEAITLVDNLEQSNRKRQTMTDKIMEEVKKEVADIDKQLLIIAEGSNWPLGIIGLAAGKIKDKFNRPILIITKSLAKVAGSGRSIPEFNMIKALDKVADCFKIYGGHAQAAGFTLKSRKYLADFKKRITEIALQELQGKDLSERMEIEAELNLQDLNWDLFEQLEKFEPFGASNPKPLFLVKNLRVENVRTVGGDNKHLKLFLKHDNMVKSFEAIGFGMGNLISEIRYEDLVDIVCEINLNEFNGTRKLELRLVDLRKVKVEDVELKSDLAKKIL
ncbi:MAG: single-stranded-DNA-specific exonuclease RecJ [Candidatus Parcubacteria bacterium]|nr:single-stranded-DNA-specific exonuclease RecJ [Candidatus Parcubacteria bacterium]